jgi:hypothetical protein
VAVNKVDQLPDGFGGVKRVLTLIGDGTLIYTTKTTSTQVVPILVRADTDTVVVDLGVLAVVCVGLLTPRGIHHTRRMSKA